MTNTILSGNLLIAKWLCWDLFVSESTNLTFCKTHEGSIQVDYLKFHSDINWQFKCLEKISKIEEVSMSKVFEYLPGWFNMSPDSDYKKLLFNEITNYISRYDAQI